MKYAILLLLTFVCLICPAVEVVDYLQDISVTVQSEGGSGSGVIVTRGDTSYILTAAHVVSSARSTRKIIDENGKEKYLVNFKTVKVVKILIEEGFTIGKSEIDAEIIRYSDADFGEDLAILKVKKKDFANATTRFYLEDKIPNLGAELFHVGSLLGPSGANSLTTGIYSQKGRIINKKVFDQTTASAFPGSSGGGVFLKNGDYCGMLVRGSGETYNLMIPIRRIKEWAKRTNSEFILNNSDKVIDVSGPIEDKQGAASFNE